MTLKEKIAEIMPNQLNSLVPGGVLKCPYEYKELHGSLKTSEIVDGWCPIKNCACEMCWDREYIEPEVKENDVTR